MINSNKNYLITGCSSGIGKALTLSLLNSGSNVFGISRDNLKVQEIIEEYPDNFFFKSVDLGAPLDLGNAVEEFVAKYGKFNGMVYCAGKEETLPLSMYTPAKLAELFNINFNSLFEIFRLVSRKKSCEDMSSFVFLSSVMGELGQAGKTGYCATKAAILGLVKAAALEFSSRKIRVNAISPGIVDTPMAQQLFTLIDDSNKQAIIDMHPLGIGKTEDIVPLITFLLSDDSRWITGQNIKIDGGYSVK
ncbi:SDR family oxidoreductase [Mucilaginibacter sp. dw_454]|uniref:SDR family NAD(P)-dependent oxidoreductase n=1 Tax=Mucilaginibacter sp. dw_454 TaxID=2720079 RepID=UPI001BD3E4BA|nr:SDR family oxidoreductase [Mucilaginibacter sp. dw_454]